MNSCAAKAEVAAVKEEIRQLVNKLQVIVGALECMESPEMARMAVHEACFSLCSVHRHVNELKKMEGDQTMPPSRFDDCVMITQIEDSFERRRALNAMRFRVEEEMGPRKTTKIQTGEPQLS